MDDYTRGKASVRWSNQRRYTQKTQHKYQNVSIFLILQRNYTKVKVIVESMWWWRPNCKQGLDYDPPKLFARTSGTRDSISRWKLSIYMNPKSNYFLDYRKLLSKPSQDPLSFVMVAIEIYKINFSIWVRKNPENLKNFIGIFSAVASRRSKAQCKDLRKLHKKHAQGNFLKILFPVIFSFRNIPFDR